MSVRLSLYLGGDEGTLVADEDEQLEWMRLKIFDRRALNVVLIFEVLIWIDSPDWRVLCGELFTSHRQVALAHLPETAAVFPQQTADSQVSHFSPLSDGLCRQS